ncbi:aldo/keto reductase [Allonocardiopsis opalescens]|uniref:Aryl-alcohol dehydrogenase-like predicted oxidoreductase n=1 Tax=Allonocardiopsis opalescens TaxID=1144618 RepID=A0A2T0PVW9_9ACTN|nr:aldo/keto reductase [Allonocardiopsis opalescens]PRX95686.1 aryl-alcohol dehydrogenase-like predicted oxidoreductase [Allonocardiopsis opalescens]
MLPTRTLGATGMDITRVGLGAWAIGGGDAAFGWGDQDDRDSVATIRYAVDQGVNWVDTAAVYGRGHSEEVVGAALRDIPDADRPYVFTKGGVLYTGGPGSTATAQVSNPGSLRREVEDSLRRLGVERIDLYQVHWPTTDGTPFEETWAAMLDLVAEGKIRAAGVSNYGVAQLEASEKAGPVGSLQPPLSAIRRDAAADVIPWCAEHGTGVIVYSPMANGLLSGGFTAERAAALPANDWRSGDPDFHGEGLAANLGLADALRPVAERHAVPVASVAVAWTLCWPGVTGAIVGARRPEQVDGWLPAASLDLTGADLDEIAAAIDRLGVGGGPARP